MTHDPSLSGLTRRPLTIVLDTSVVTAAVLGSPDGPSAAVMSAMEAGLVQVVSSPAWFDEIAELAALAHARGAAFHCDAAQAAGKVPVNVEGWGVDLLSLSAHKFYGPKGVGALYVRGGASTRRLAPLGLGGGQEHGLRHGTHNVPGIVGLGEAARIALEELPAEVARLAALRDRLEARLEHDLPSLRVNGRGSPRLPGSSSLTLPGLEADALLANLPELSLSTGSACTAGAVEPSHVLTALGLSRADAHATVRVGIGRFNTAPELEHAATALLAAARRLLARPA